MGLKESNDMNEWEIFAVGLITVALIYHIIAFFLEKKDKDN